MAEVTFWRLIQQSNLSRNLFPAVGTRVPVKSTSILISGFSARVQISSQKATLNPQWQTGGFAFWGINSVSGFERIIEPRSINLPLNTPAIILVPAYLKEPWLQVEIPSWIPDAVLSVWQVSTTTTSPGGNSMQITNPLVIPQSVAPYSPQALSGTQSTVLYSADTVSVLAANTERKGFFIKNESTASVRLQLAAQGNIDESPFELEAGGQLSSESINYTGQIYAKWLSADLNGRLEVVEFAG